MSNLKDRINAEKKATPTETAVKQILRETTKKKYPVNVIFDGEYEQTIRNAASAKGVGVATFIRMCVIEKLSKDKIDIN